MNVKNYLSNQLRLIADKIDDGSCEVNDEQVESAISLLGHKALSKEEACNFLRILRSTFDTKIRNGELPPGRKRQGWKELIWYQDELL